MEIHPGITMVDGCLLVGSTLVISDPHFGFEEEVNSKGTLIPRFQWKDTKKRLDAIFSFNTIDTVVLNGDVKHAYGQIRETEWRYVLRVLDLLMEHAKVIVVQGNHDLFLAPIARKRDITLVSEYRVDSVLIVHGDEDVDVSGVDVVIMGHEHCAISLRRGQRSEKYKCFLKGKYKGKVLIAMPSFNELTYGTDVLTQDLLSPLLKNIDDFAVFAIADMVYPFGPVKKLRKMMQKAL